MALARPSSPRPRRVSGPQAAVSSRSPATRNGCAPMPFTSGWAMYGPAIVSRSSSRNRRWLRRCWPAATDRDQQRARSARADPFDVGADRLELLLKPFIAAIEMIDPVDLGHPVRDQTGQDEAHRGAEIGRHDGRADQAAHPPHDGGEAPAID